MPVAPELVGASFVAIGGGILLLLREAIRHREQPGTIGFFLTVFGISVWSVAQGLLYLLPAVTSGGFFDWPVDVGTALLFVRVSAATVTSAGWFLLAYSFTKRQAPSRRLGALVGGYVVVDLLLFAGMTTFAHPDFLIYQVEPVDAVPIVEIRTTRAFQIHTLVSYGFTLAGTALVLVEAVRSAGLRRRQSIVLAAAALPPFGANVLTLFGTISTPYDLTPLGLVWTGLLFGWGLYRMELLDITPVARQTAMEVMHDAVVTLDTEDRVVDCNAAARELFDVGQEYFGMSAPTFFSPVSAATLERFENSENVDTELTVELDGEQRHFSLSISPIESEEGTRGRVIVLRNITPIKRREQDLESREAELDLLRQVFSRVLRHNLRNELTVIHGAADQLASSAPPSQAERAQQIVDASEELLALSEKSRDIEKIIDSDAEAKLYDLCAVLDTVVDAVRTEHPDVPIEVDVPEECQIRFNNGLEAALENVVENAARYSDDDDPNVRIAFENGSRPRLRVVDNGSGIPDEEIAVLDEGAETQLFHGSGLGLWLVKWIVDRSDATIEFDASDDGTEVTFEFSAVDDRPPTDDHDHPTPTA